MMEQLSWCYMSHGDFRCTVDSTVNFVNFGQNVTPLSLLEIVLKFLR